MGASGSDECALCPPGKHVLEEGARTIDACQLSSASIIESGTCRSHGGTDILNNQNPKTKHDANYRMNALFD